MEASDEERLLRKEIAFLNARWETYRHNLRTVTVGRVTAVVNGMASPHYAFHMYLQGRLRRAYARLKELGVTL